MYADYICLKFVGNILCSNVKDIKRKRNEASILAFFNIDAQRTLPIPKFLKIEAKQTLLIQELKKIEAKRPLLIPDVRKIKAKRTLLIQELKKIETKRPLLIPVPEFLDPVFTKTSPKRSFSVIQNERFGLVFRVFRKTEA